MGKVRLMNKRFVRNERGGAHIVLFALLAVVFSVTLSVVSVQWMLQTANKTKTKLALDRAVHAAALNLDEREAAYGRLVWDEAAGERDFYRYLRLNLQLDDSGEPLPDSHLETTPVVHGLEFVEFPTYPSVLSRSVVVDDGKESETVRHVEVTVYGPSVVAFLEVRQRTGGRWFRQFLWR